MIYLKVRTYVFLFILDNQSQGTWKFYDFVTRNLELEIKLFLIH